MSPIILVAIMLIYFYITAKIKEANDPYNAAGRILTPVTEYSVTQSSDYINNVYPASYAIDGNLTTFTHTSAVATENAWFKIDLLQNRNVKQVVIVNRQDCCQDRLTTAVLNAINEAGVIVKSMAFGAINNQYTLNIKSPARYLQIRLGAKETALSIADLQILTI